MTYFFYFQLLDAQEEIILIKERFEECNKEKSYLLGELNALKEQLQLLSIQSKTVCKYSTSLRIFSIHFINYECLYE